MLEMKDGKKILTTPISAEDLKGYPCRRYRILKWKHDNLS